MMDAAEVVALLEPRGCLSPNPAMRGSAALGGPAKGTLEAATPQQPPSAAAEQAGSAQEGLQPRGWGGAGEGLLSPGVLTISSPPARCHRSGDLLPSRAGSVRVRILRNAGCEHLAHRGDVPMES